MVLFYTTCAQTKFDNDLMHDNDEINSLFNTNHHSHFKLVNLFHLHNHFIRSLVLLVLVETMVQVPRWPFLNPCISKMLHCEYEFVQMKRIVDGNGRMVDENDDCCCCVYCCGVDLLLLLSAAAAVMVAAEATGIVCSMSPLLPSLLL